MFEWCVVMSGSKNIHREGHVLKRDWTTCSKFLIIPGSIVNIIVGGTHMLIY